MPQDQLDEIRKAADGLLYPSETDAPFDVFRWPPGRGSARDQLTSRAAKGRAIEEVPVDDFFAALDATDDAERFRQLRQALQSKLSGLSVFRLGEVQIDIYLIGRTSGGDWAGLHTVSVET